MSKNKKSLIRGAIFLGAGAFLSKALGAIYRVPLTNLLGGYGLGLYQIVFPVYSLLLDFSGAGVPSALSGLIAKKDDKESVAHAYLKTTIKMLLLIGVIGTLSMLIFSKPISKFQGNGQAYLAYLYLAPAVFAVALICAFRGYFQGLMNMKPTAVSQVIEQAVKVVFGILLVKTFLPNVEKAVAGATFAITISEFLALAYLTVVYFMDKKRKKLNDFVGAVNEREMQKEVIKKAVPITLISMVIPFSHFIDSFLIVNLLSTYRQDATALYGVLSGACLTVINLPVSLCYGFSTVAIPSVSSLKTEREKQERAKKVIFFTVVFSLPCALFCCFFSPFIVNLLFKGLSLNEKEIAISLLRFLSPSIILLSVVQTQNAVLIGKDRAYKPIISLSFGVVVKIFLNVVLLKNPRINIYGSAVALIACYFVSCLINLIMIFGVKVKNANTSARRREYAS